MIAVWGPVQAQAPKPANESAIFRFRIWSDQNSYRPREDFPIHVELTNVSSHNVLVGTDLWTNASPSRVTFAVTPIDGHKMGGIRFAVDGGYPPGALPDDFADALLKWCFLLPPQNSYASVERVGNFVNKADLIPGSYKIHAIYESLGVDADTYLNPLLGHPRETARLQTESWKGIIGSNEITIRIMAGK